MECFLVELNLRKRKWLISCSYNLNKNNISKHIEIQSKNLDLYSSQYKSNIIIGDHHNPSCIGLILTNSPCSFQGSCVVETGLFEFHRMGSHHYELRNSFLRHRSNENRQKYSKQRNCLFVEKNKKELLQKSYINLKNSFNRN